MKFSKDIIEIRIHGRGGQGAVTSAELLAIAAFKDGKYSQAMPKFGPERRGSPVEAYCRISNEFITLRTHVYEPDYIIVLDSSLANVVDFTSGLNNNGIILINSNEAKSFSKFKTISIDADKIAMETFGRPIPNTVMLGAFAKATNIISLKSLLEAIEERFENKELAEKNKIAIKKAYDEVKL
ncbi:MAG: pyruvate ferredoxin oxidoreductase subunit gamma [Candidatus Aenigmatarchaeota archaeon]